MSGSSTHPLRDTAAFLDELSGHGGFFVPGRDLVVTRAPGRLDLMGGIADYSGSLVLELPIEAATHVAFQPNADEFIRIISLSAESERQYEMRVSELYALGGYGAARARFEADPKTRWAAYVIGAFLVLMQEKGASGIAGGSLLIRSDVPEGKGVSSSAALEVAVMRALVSVYDLDAGGEETAFLCQKVENLVAGAPCGVMDQMTAACGEEGRLLALLCQPGEVKGTIALPEGLSVWGIDSGIRHAVSGADYGTVRTAAFMGYRIIADMAGLEWRRTTTAGLIEIDDSRWHGYLANIGTVEFRKKYAAALPVEMRGDAFLTRYSGTTDPVTSIKPEVSYPVLEATRHPIEAHERVSSFAKMLREWRDENDASRLGAMMYESHASYSACGLGSSGTDDLVEAVRRAGVAKGLFGAKITGGGSGGTVAVLGRSDAEDEVKAIAREYSERTGREAQVITGSSSGAMSFGHLRLRR